MSGQRPDEDDEQEEEEEQNLLVADAQHVFDDDEVENESAEEHSMLAPSSLAASSEDGSQLADDDCGDTATPHDEVSMAPPCHTLVLSARSSFRMAHTTLLIPTTLHPTAFECSSNRGDVAPGTCNHPHRGDFYLHNYLGGKRLSSS